MSRPPQPEPSDDPTARDLAIMVLRHLLADWNRGRLTPLPFVLLFGVAMAGAYLFSFAFMAIFETSLNTDGRGAGYAAGPLGLPLTRQGVLWFSFLMLSLFTLGGANVMAKRFRDMGLPGGLAVSMLAIMLIVLIGGGSTISFL
ncbi:MAG: hypothetical protein KI785_07925 [Devosiaceae bacterium]|nr:hypothetical protein [Devosiaceae bacterium MH13]